MPETARASLSIEVVVPIWRHGREAVPTVRSIHAAAARVPDAVVGITLAVTAECVPRIPPGVAEKVEIVSVAEARDSAQLVAAAVRYASADVVGVVEAGDLVGATWLSGAWGLPPLTVVRPETVVTFGRRTGIGRSPRHATSRYLVHAEVLSSAFLTLRETLSAAMADAVPNGGASGLAAALAYAGCTEAVEAETTVFVRRWEEADPRWRPGPVLDPIPLLSDSRMGEGVVVRTAALTVPPSARRVIRALRRTAAPWIDAVATAVRKARPLRLPEALERQWREANKLEPLVPYPRPDVAGWVERWGALPASIRAEIDAYSFLVSQLPPTIDYLFFAPWLRTGGGDSVLAEYMHSVRRSDPDASIVLVTTEPIVSTRLDRVPSGAVTIELETLLCAGVSRDAFVEWIVPQLIAQYRPHTVHAFNSTVAFDVIERYGKQLAHHTRLFLSTFAVDRSADGEALSVLFLRPPGFLDVVERVLVDSERFIERMAVEWGYDAEKFAVQRSVVDVTRRAGAPPPRAGRERLQVLWAGRFDLPKRLDVLARVSARAAERGVPVTFHFYGDEVMGDAGLLESLSRLEASGAVRHPPFERFADLPLQDFDAYILTSEWEGVPLTVLEAMGARLPVIAPLVGGVGEVIDDSTGFPVRVFDDIDGYVDACEQIIAEPDSAALRADRACARVREEFSRDAFDRRLASLAGYLRS